MTRRRPRPAYTADLSTLVLDSWALALAALAETDPAAYKLAMREARSLAARIGERQKNGGVISPAGIMVTQLVRMLRGGYEGGPGTKGPPPEAR